MSSFGVLALASMLLFSCNGSSPAKPKLPLSDAQTVSFPIPGGFDSLDPAVLSRPADAEIAQNLFDGLVRLDDAMRVVPDIAASLPSISADGLTYTFKLRAGVLFSNGDRLSSSDVLYSWNRAAAMQGPYASNLSAIAGYGTVAGTQSFGSPLEAPLEKKDPSVTMSGLSAPDPLTVVVKLSVPAGWFLTAIA